MIRYCRAYEVARLRHFPDAAGLADAGTELVYLWDDYSVTTAPFADATPALGGDSADWRAYCADVLRFDPPAPADAAGDERSSP